MKVLLNCNLPFALAHGGVQIQIEQTKAALERAGVTVEFLRWWDESQRGDLIHFFGPPVAAHPDFVRRKNMKLVVTHLLGGLGARTPWKRAVQKIIMAAARQTLPAAALARTGWPAWQAVDALVAITPWEAQLMREVFQVPAHRVHTVSNGVDDFFFKQPAVTRGPWLVTTASILPVKRLVETATAAVAARTPYWVIGRPFSESDAYFQEFSRLCTAHPDLLRHDNVMRSRPELAEIYRQARGFVLLSRWETQSLSALEAAACACPLLLGDLPWARVTFGAGASYCPLTQSVAVTAARLREFYEAAPTLPAPAKPASWDEIGLQLKKIYTQELSTSR